MGLGSIYDHPPTGGSATSVGWHVHSPSELLSLVCVLDDVPLRGRKLRQYDAWRPAALEVGVASRDGRRPRTDLLTSARTKLREASEYDYSTLKFPQ